MSLSPSQQLARSLDQAATVENQGQLGVAAQLYQSILASHPDNEVALAQLGWLEYRIGRQGSSATLIADARTKLIQATTLVPGDYAAHLYLGTILLQQDGNAAGAADQFRLVPGGPAAVGGADPGGVDPARRLHPGGRARARRGSRRGVRRLTPAGGHGSERRGPAVGPAVGPGLVLGLRGRGRPCRPRTCRSGPP